MSKTAVLIRGVDRTLYNNIVAKAKEHGKNVADLMNEAMRVYLNDPAPKHHDVFDTKKLIIAGSVSLSKSDIIGIHDEVGKFFLENSGELTIDRDVDKEAMLRIERIHNTGKLRVPSTIHHLALMKVGHVHGEVEKY